MRVLFAMLILLALPAHARWVPVARPTTAPLNAVAMLPGGSGWAVGDAGTVFATADGGQTWETQRTPLTNRLLSVSFASPLVGWASGEGDGAARTTNGGLSWERVTVVTDDLGLGPPDTLAPIIATDENHVWALARWGHASFLYRTTDGGATWQTVRYSDRGYNSPNTVYAMDFRSALEGWLIASRIGGPPAAYTPVFLRTDDGGATWLAMDAYATNLNQYPTPDWRVSVDTASSTDMLAHVFSPASGLGVLYRVGQDPQDLWRQIPIPLEAPLGSVSYPEPPAAWLVGAATWQSADYAHTFRLIPNPGDGVLTADFPAPGAGWAVSPDGWVLAWVPDLPGDVDASGAVDVVDALLALQVATGLRTVDALSAYLADISPAPDGDGAVTPSDAFAILRRAAGMG